MRADRGLWKAGAQGSRFARGAQLLDPVGRRPAVDEQCLGTDARGPAEADRPEGEALLRVELHGPHRGDAVQSGAGGLVLGPALARSGQPLQRRGAGADRVGRRHGDLRVGSDRPQGLGHHAGRRAEVRQALRLRDRRSQVHVRDPGAQLLRLRAQGHRALPVLQDRSLRQPPGQSRRGGQWRARRRHQQHRGAVVRREGEPGDPCQGPGDLDFSAAAGVRHPGAQGTGSVDQGQAAEVLLHLWDRDRGPG